MGVAKWPEHRFQDVEELGGCCVGGDFRSIGFYDAAPVGLLQIEGDVVLGPGLREHLEVPGRRVLRRMVAYRRQPRDAVDPLVGRRALAVQQLVIRAAARADEHFAAARSPERRNPARNGRRVDCGRSAGNTGGVRDLERVQGRPMDLVHVPVSLAAPDAVHRRTLSGRATRDHGHEQHRQACSLSRHVAHPFNVCRSRHLFECRPSYSGRGVRPAIS